MNSIIENCQAEDHSLMESNRMFSASEGEITLFGRTRLSPLSPERILQSDLSERATNDISFEWGAISFASFTLSSNDFRGINSISFFINENISTNSSLEKCVNLIILSSLLPISKNRNSGAINSNFLIKELTSNTNKGLPLVKRAENTVLVSDITNILVYSLRSLLVISKPTSSASSEICFSVALDFEIMASIFLNSSNFDFRNLENKSCQASFDILSNSMLISSGMDIVISTIGECNNIDYLNFFTRRQDE